MHAEEYSGGRGALTNPIFIFVGKYLIFDHLTTKNAVLCLVRFFVDITPDLLLMSIQTLKSLNLKAVMFKEGIQIQYTSKD